MYQFAYHNLFARLDAEQTHHRASQFLRLIGNISPLRAGLASYAATNTTGMSMNALGLTFDHPLGLAGGFDKDANCLPGLSALGFSFVEVGSVTPRPQPGNEGKRIIRVIEEQALVNRMGFPSIGAPAVAQRLAHLHHFKGRIGISLGKNKETPLTDVFGDYQATLNLLYPYGDFFVINISSPNTANLRMLQTSEYLGSLLSSVRQQMSSLAQGQRSKPLLIKIAADLTWEQIDHLIDLCLTHQVDGVVATNTLPVERTINGGETFSGGLSGQPLREKSSEIIRYIHQKTRGKLCIIGVGGIFTGDDIWDKMVAGASLVQSYTGFIYRGPFFVKNALRELRQRMDREGVQTLAEIVGR